MSYVFSLKSLSKTVKSSEKYLLLVTLTESPSFKNFTNLLPSESVYILYTVSSIIMTFLSTFVTYVMLPLATSSEGVAKSSLNDITLLMDLTVSLCIGFVVEETTMEESSLNWKCVPSNVLSSQPPIIWKYGSPSYFSSLLKLGYSHLLFPSLSSLYTIGRPW